MIGSALAIYHLLKGLGKEATLASADPIPEIYFFLPAVKKIKIGDPQKLPLEKFDLIFLADTPSLTRFSREGKVAIPPKTIVINVDHHESNHKFGQLNYLAPQAAATTEVLYDLLRMWKLPISPEIATCLLTGIYTDTGGFIYPSATANSLSKAADLIRRGADRDAVAENSFRSWSPKALPIWSQILANTKIKGTIAYSQMDYAGVRKIDPLQNELAEVRAFAVSNLVLSIRGVRAAALFTEEKPREIRVNLRSTGSVDVDKIAAKFDGGGHRNSAAFDYHGHLKEAVAKTVRLLQGAVD